MWFFKKFINFIKMGQFNFFHSEKFCQISWKIMIFWYEIFPSYYKSKSDFWSQMRGRTKCEFRLPTSDIFDIWALFTDSSMIFLFFDRYQKLPSLCTVNPAYLWSRDWIFFKKLFFRQNNVLNRCDVKKSKKIFLKKIQSLCHK